MSHGISSNDKQQGISQAWHKLTEIIQNIILSQCWLAQWDVRKADMREEEFEGLFKGEGFTRLVLAGGGVPRDCLSLFLDALDNAEPSGGRIGKDEVRILSFSNFQKRIDRRWQPILKFLKSS